MTRIVREEDVWRQMNDMARQIQQLQRLVAQPPEFITDKRLPENPYPDQEIIFQFSEGVNWRLRYNANSSSPNKWESVGGSSARADATVGVDITSGTPAAWTTGPLLTLPLAGRYDVTFCAHGMVDSSTTYEAQARATLYVDTSTTNQIAAPKSTPGMPNDGAIYTPSVNHALVDVNAGQQLKLYVSLSRPGGAAGTARFASNGSYIIARPIRVG